MSVYLFAILPCIYINNAIQSIYLHNNLVFYFYVLVKTFVNLVNSDIVYSQNYVYYLFTK